MGSHFLRKIHIAWEKKDFGNATPQYLICCWKSPVIQIAECVQYLLSVIHTACCN